MCVCVCGVCCTEWCPGRDVYVCVCVFFSVLLCSCVSLCPCGVIESFACCCLSAGSGGEGLRRGWNEWGLMVFVVCPWVLWCV